MREILGVLLLCGVFGKDLCDGGALAGALVLSGLNQRKIGLEGLSGEGCVGGGGSGMLSGSWSEEGRALSLRARST